MPVSRSLMRARTVETERQADRRDSPCARSGMAGVAGAKARFGGLIFATDFRVLVDLLAAVQQGAWYIVRVK